MSAMVPQFLGQVPSRVGRPVLSIPGSQAATGGGVLLILGPRFGTWCIFERHHWKGQCGGEAVPTPGGWREPQLGLVCQQSRHRVG